MLTVGFPADLDPPQLRKSALADKNPQNELLPQQAQLLNSQTL